ncbi:hypothetical protein ACKWTF_015555 [Chironomus riparius]
MNSKSYLLILCVATTLQFCTCNIIPSEELQKVSDDLGAKYPEEPKHVKCIIEMLNHEAIKRNITFAQLQAEDFDVYVKTSDSLCRHYAMMESEYETEAVITFSSASFVVGLIIGLIVGVILGLVILCLCFCLCG